MTGHHIRAALAEFLLHLETLGPEGQREAIVNEVRESGGSYTVPHPGDNWASCFVEISLLEVAAYGADEGEAIRNWKRAARYVAVALTDSDYQLHETRRFGREQIAEFFSVRRA